MKQRIHDEPAFILHSHDWSESSLIVHAFTRHRGRISILAKGAKKPTSNFRSVLLALQPLRLSYSAQAEPLAAGIATQRPMELSTNGLHTLKAAQWAGGHTIPQGAALLSGLYLNELLMRLLARDDPFAHLFDVYTSVVQLLATQPNSVAPALLRAFELVLLRELGLLPSLRQCGDGSAAQAHTCYTLLPEVGLTPVAAHERASLNGQQWVDLDTALGLEHQPIDPNSAYAAQSWSATVAACATLDAALKPQLRQLLQHHCGAPALRTRELMVRLQKL